MIKSISVVLCSLFLFSCSPAFHNMAHRPPIHFFHFDGILNLIIKILIIVALVLLIKNLYDRDRDKRNKKE